MISEALSRLYHSHNTDHFNFLPFPIFSPGNCVRAPRPPSLNSKFWLWQDFKVITSRKASKLSLRKSLIQQIACTQLLRSSVPKAQHQKGLDPEFWLYHFLMMSFGQSICNCLFTYKPALKGLNVTNLEVFRQAPNIASPQLRKWLHNSEETRQDPWPILITLDYILLYPKFIFS